MRIVKIVRFFVSVILAIMIVAWISSAVMTVMPDSSASKVSYFGYKAHCSFTPYSTIISIIGAVITYLIARKCGYLAFK